jgi:beta-galactosidase GanA
MYEYFNTLIQIVKPSFSSWKNGESSCQPYWLKTDPQRFPWVKDRTGKTLNILSTFGDATCEADARAYAALMRHIREVDGKEHTVLMMQVENEVGVLGDSRDHIAAANEAFAKPVPKDLIDDLWDRRQGWWPRPDAGHQ